MAIRTNVMKNREFATTAADGMRTTPPCPLALVDGSGFDLGVII